MLQNAISVSYGLMFNFTENSQLFSQVPVPFYIPTNKEWESQFFIFASLYYFHFLKN